MRHAKNTLKLNRDSGHRRCLIANMLKALIATGRIETTVAKAKVLKTHADQMVTLAKKNTLASRRKAIADLMIRYNALTSQERKALKAGDQSVIDGDRIVMKKLFDEYGKRFETRQGGYTRIIRMNCRRGDGAEKCILEYLEA
jgi:large subunit ribosomal protein L17